MTEERAFQVESDARELRLVLASSSPRRSALLALAGFEFEVRHPDVDETPLTGELPVPMVRRLALAKARDVAPRAEECALGLDTVVVVGDTMLGKPRSADHAVEMLLQIAGRTHEVYTGYATVAGGDAKAHIGVAESRVTLREITHAEAVAYVATGEPMDKAGAYGIQGTAGKEFVTEVEGTRSNVAGMPLNAVVPLLASYGIRRKEHEDAEH